MKPMQWLRLQRLRDFLAGEAAGGVILMVVAAFALLVANSPFASIYFDALYLKLGPLSVQHWINDGLMALFFLLVGTEIKREACNGELATWPQRILPGACALGGMLVPALIYAAFNHDDARALRGWAIPTATDIAFALGVISLLGKRVPISLKVFLAALAIIDDLGAVLIIAMFYSSDLAPGYLAAAAAVVAVLMLLARLRVRQLWPYLLLGAILWVLVLNSGVHATLAGVALALVLPLGADGDDVAGSPLLRVERGLHRFVPFLIVPIFGFANAGVSFASVGAAQLIAPLTLGVALGLLLGKIIGVLGSAWMMIRFGYARLPQAANWLQMAGVAALCGIGFTMSLFVGLLAFANNPLLQTEVKIGILCGSLCAGVLGWLVLRLAAADPVAAA
jgi:NhaA family Na+:H+ antiporter